MNDVAAMQGLKAPSLDNAQKAERLIEGLIADQIIIAVAHGFELPEELKGLGTHLENLRRVRLSIAMTPQD